MRILIIVLLFTGVLTCCCTSKPAVIEPIVIENRLVDSCEVFSRRLKANMIFGLGPAGKPQYSIRGEWAKKSRKYRGLFNIDEDFITYKNCLIGLTAEQLTDLLGKPSYRDNSYFYIREDTSSVRTPLMPRTGCIDVTTHDTVRTVTYGGQCIRIK